MPSRSARVLAAVSVWPCVGVPEIVTAPVGLSLTAMMVTMVDPVATNAPPVPWSPVLPSLKPHSITTLAGGASEALA